MYTQKQNTTGTSTLVGVFATNLQISNTEGMPSSSDKETFEDDDSGTKAVETLISRCGTGNISKLQPAANILRLESSCTTYTDIVDYVKNSSDGKKIVVKRIFKIERFADQPPLINEPFRILLWHGTSPNSIPGIVETGFRRGHGGMFGGGIYFADRIAKSATYVTKNPLNGSVFFVLAEIFPGKVYKAHHFHTNYKSAPKGFDSVKGNGSEIPIWKDNRDFYGAIMPCGKTKRNPRHSTYDMKYNEYILYDMNRVIVRFVVECSM